MSEIEDLFAFQLRAVGIEYDEQFKIDGERYIWDFRVGDCLIEVQGGIWQKGGHSTGKGITRDCKKANVATLHGYRTLFFTTDMVRNGEALDTIGRYLKLL